MLINTKDATNTELAEAITDASLRLSERVYDLSPVKDDPIIWSVLVLEDGRSGGGETCPVEVSVRHYQAITAEDARRECQRVDDRAVIVGVVAGGIQLS